MLVAVAVPVSWPVNEDTADAVAPENTVVIDDAVAIEEAEANADAELERELRVGV